MSEETTLTEAERLAEQLGQLHRDHPTTEMGEAAQVMVAMLDVALHGGTWARPQSPEQVWRVLLDEVSRLRDAEQRAEQLQRDLAATARLLGEAQERAERAEATLERVRQVEESWRRGEANPAPIFQLAAAVLRAVLSAPADGSGEG